ncbi:MAG: Sua5/YciO/YrdC/YwlC family protein, partial [Pseudomonadota bacterium]
LGCDPLNRDAVVRLLEIKNRDVNKGLILISDNMTRLRPFMGELTKTQEQRLTKYWPGPVTWLVPAHPDVPVWLTGEHQTLAMRVTNHPVAAGLCTTCDMPLVSTSANIAGFAPTKTRLATQLRLGLTVDYILPGRVGDQSTPSQIRDLDTDTIIRA